MCFFRADISYPYSSLVLFLLFSHFILFMHSSCLRDFHLPVASFHFPLRIVSFFLYRNNDSAAILIEIFPWTHKTFTVNSSNCLLCAATYILRPITFRLRFAYHITLMVEIIFVVSPRRVFPVVVIECVCVCVCVYESVCAFLCLFVPSELQIAHISAPLPRNKIYLPNLFK